MKYFFLDTNVVLDFLIDRKPFSFSAAKLFDYSEKGKVKLYTAAISYTTIYYVVKKFTAHKDTIRILKDLEKLTETLDTTGKTIRESLLSDFKDFEDAIQYYTAATEKKIDAIVTRNSPDFNKSEMAVMTPEEAVGLLNSAG